MSTWKWEKMTGVKEEAKSPREEDECFRSSQVSGVDERTRRRSRSPIGRTAGGDFRGGRWTDRRESPRRRRESPVRRIRGSGLADLGKSPRRRREAPVRRTETNNTADQDYRPVGVPTGPAADRRTAQPQQGGRRPDERRSDQRFGSQQLVGGPSAQNAARRLGVQQFDHRLPAARTQHPVAREDSRSTGARSVLS